MREACQKQEMADIGRVASENNLAGALTKKTINAALSTALRTGRLQPQVSQRIAHEQGHQ